MQIRLGTVAGHTYESDVWSDDEATEQMEESNWMFGDGFLETQLTPGDLDSLCNHMEEFMKDLISGKHKNANITLVNDGQNMVFAADKVVWIQVVR